VHDCLVVSVPDDRFGEAITGHPRRPTAPIDPEIVRESGSLAPVQKRATLSSSTRSCATVARPTTAGPETAEKAVARQI
jgi:hypothetical protein